MIFNRKNTKSGSSMLVIGTFNGIIWTSKGHRQPCLSSSAAYIFPWRIDTTGTSNILVSPPQLRCGLHRFTQWLLGALFQELLPHHISFGPKFSGTLKSDSTVPTFQNHSHMDNALKFCYKMQMQPGPLRPKLQWPV